MTEPLTAQEYLDLLLEASAGGRFPSADRDTDGLIACRYRGPGGRRCAAGLLIPDGRYDPGLEGKAAWHSAVADRLTRVEGFRQSPDSAQEDDYHVVQRVHDKLATTCLKEDRPWDHAWFVASLRALPCFAGCTFPGGS